MYGLKENLYCLQSIDRRGLEHHFAHSGYFAVILRVRGNSHSTLQMGERTLSPIIAVRDMRTPIIGAVNLRGVGYPYPTSHASRCERLSFY